MAWCTFPSSILERVERVEDLFNVGDEMTVMITGIDDGGKIRLSRQAVLEGWSSKKPKNATAAPAAVVPPEAGQVVVAGRAATAVVTVAALAAPAVSQSKSI